MRWEQFTEKAREALAEATESAAAARHSEVTPEHLLLALVSQEGGIVPSILGRLSNGSYRGFDIRQGDTVVLSSHPIPGNEENVYRTINRLFERGANVLYEAIAPVHVSGHASQEEMKLMINLVRPKFFIPIHGELRQLKRHAYIAEQMGKVLCVPKSLRATGPEAEAARLAWLRGHAGVTQRSDLRAGLRGRCWHLAALLVLFERRPDTFQELSEVSGLIVCRHHNCNVGVLDEFVSCLHG